MLHLKKAVCAAKKTAAVVSQRAAPVDYPSGLTHPG
jgi:hypothetical protein